MPQIHKILIIKVIILIYFINYKFSGFNKLITLSSFKISIETNPESSIHLIESSSIDKIPLTVVITILLTAAHTISLPYLSNKENVFSAIDELNEKSQNIHFNFADELNKKTDEYVFFLRNLYNTDILLKYKD